MKLKVREHRFQKRTAAILEQVQEVLDGYRFPVSVRQVHYRLVALGVLPNTASTYRKVSRMLSDGRYAGLLDWDKIVDETRGAEKPPDWGSLEERLDAAVENFRLDRWAETGRYVEVWAEKRTMGQLLYPITSGLDVTLVIGAGFNSTTAIWEAVGRLVRKRDREIHVLYLGDFDPSGESMDSDIEARLSDFGIPATFRRLLLNLDDVERYDLPPAFEVRVRRGGRVYDKLKADPRAKKFVERYGRLMQVEIEALDPNILTRELETAIRELLPETAYREALDEEERQRERYRQALDEARDGA